MPFTWVPAFLAALSKVPNVAAAARASGITRMTAYNHRKGDPEFAAAWEDALDQSTDDLVGEMYRRAVEGVDEPVFHDGEVCGHKRRYSDTLAMFLARAHRPDVYGDRLKADVTTNGQSITDRVVIYLPDNGRNPAAGNPA